MKKTISILVFTMILACAVPAHAKTVNYATEYLEVINSYASKYGISQESNTKDSTNVKNGILHCELIDFDGNGTPELYMIVKKSKKWLDISHYIYSYANQSAFFVHEETSDVSALNFVNIGGKTYIYKEDGNETMSSKFIMTVQYETYYKLAAMLEFNGQTFREIWGYVRYDAGSPNYADLVNHGITKNSGYNILYKPKDGYYFANKTTVFKYGVPESVIVNDAGEYSADDAIAAYMGISTKDFYNNSVRYINYVGSMGAGYSFTDNIQFNTSFMQNSLYDISLIIDNDYISVYLEGQEIDFDSPPVQENGRTLVPLRAAAEEFNADVEWNEELQCITITTLFYDIWMQINNPYIFVNGVRYELEVPPKTIYGSTYVPVRDMAEILNIEVIWDSESNSIFLEY